VIRDQLPDASSVLLTEKLFDTVTQTDTFFRIL
jgi:hypothetical protein